MSANKKDAVMEFLFRLKLTTEGIIQDILQSSLNTFFATAVIFIFSIFGFALIYIFLNYYHQVSYTRYKGKNLVGFTVPLPAFQVSDILRNRLEVKAMNDLRLRRFAGEVTNISWQSLRQDNSISRRFPDDKTDWTEFRDTQVLGIKPTKMVEEIFPKYGLLKFKITHYDDNYFDILFPIAVLHEYFNIYSVEDLQRRRDEGTLTPEEKSLHDGLVAVASQIRTRFLESKDVGQLAFLSMFLKDRASEAEKGLQDKERFRDIFYGEILSILTGYQTRMEFYFDSLPLTPEASDFVYMSTTLATSNIPADIVPITSDVRFLMWFQLIISYFILALNVAALVKLLKIG